MKKVVEIFKKVVNLLKPEWVTEEWREGSMGATDKKENYFVVGVGSAIFLLIFAMLYFNLFNTYFYEYYVRAPFGWHIVSWGFAFLSMYSLWSLPDVISGSKNSWTLGALVLVFLALTIITGAGFDFNLHGIE